MLLRCVLVLLWLLPARWASAQTDTLKQLQEAAVKEGKATWGHWGPDSQRYVSWSSHSNRLIPVYVFGGNLKEFCGEASVYRQPRELERLYGRPAADCFYPKAQYCDQTDLYRLQEAGHCPWKAVHRADGL